LAKFRIEKVVSSLPATLVPDTVYAVRVGTGFDLYVSDTTGSTAHKLNEVNTQRTDEEIQDVVNSLLVGSGNITLTYDDVNNTLTIDDTHTHTASEITDFDTEVSNNTDVSSNTANRHSHSNKTILDNTTASYTTTEETKLAGIEDSANNYSHPSSHSPSIITQDSNNRFVTDTQINSWDSKAEGSHTHTESDITDLQNYEPAFTKNTAFNKNFGTSAGTVSEGNHNHDSTYLGINAKATDANLLDGLNSSQFLRSDADDTTTGKLTANGGYETGNFQIQFNSTTNSLDFNYIGA